MKLDSIVTASPVQALYAGSETSLRTGGPFGATRDGDSPSGGRPHSPNRRSAARALWSHARRGVCAGHSLRRLFGFLWELCAPYGPDRTEASAPTARHAPSITGGRHFDNDLSIRAPQAPSRLPPNVQKTQTHLNAGTWAGCCAAEWAMSVGWSESSVCAICSHPRATGSDGDGNRSCSTRSAQATLVPRQP